MKYSTLPPPIHLQPYIRCFWVLEHEFSIGEDSYIYRSVADGCVEMVFHYQSAFEELITSGTAHNWRSGIHFQSSHYRRFETKQSFGLFGAYIYPFAIPYFFRVPSAETSNEMLDLETFLGFAGRELEEKIMIAPDNQKRVEILTAFFENRLPHLRLKDNAIACSIKHVIHSGRLNTVEELAYQFNLSVRQFDRKFKAYAGFGPKMYLRLVRLSNALKQDGRAKSLSRISHECGYYDQSHFIHDVKAFTGYHPGFYFSGKAEGTEYRYV